jgi:hypothetical protein
MTQFEPFDDGVEANGQAVLSVIEAFPAALQSQADGLLAENGIDDPQPTEWYPQAAWLAAFKRIATDIGENSLRKIGQAIPDNAEWPPGVDSVVGGL